MFRSHLLYFKISSEIPRLLGGSKSNRSAFWHVTSLVIRRHLIFPPSKWRRSEATCWRDPETWRHQLSDAILFFQNGVGANPTAGGAGLLPPHGESRHWSALWREAGRVRQVCMHHSSYTEVLGFLSCYLVKGQFFGAYPEYFDRFRP